MHCFVRIPYLPFHPSSYIHTYLGSCERIIWFLYFFLFYVLSLFDFSEYSCIWYFYKISLITYSECWIEIFRIFYSENFIIKFLTFSFHSHPYPCCSRKSHELRVNVWVSVTIIFFHPNWIIIFPHNTKLFAVQTNEWTNERTSDPSPSPSQSLNTYHGVI